jgi:hypothetical protein
MKALLRHELSGDFWRATPTTDPKQPRTGFTVAADLPEREVNMLRQTYAVSDLDGREMIRKMAALSVSR